MEPRSLPLAVLTYAHSEAESYRGTDLCAFRSGVLLQR